MVAYDSIVTIVEPEGSVFDFKLYVQFLLLSSFPHLHLLTGSGLLPQHSVSTYLVVSAILGALVYTAYATLLPQPKKLRRTKPAVSAPVGTVTATGAGGYQEEWIPEHHLRKTGRKKSGAVSGTSGDELSGGEELKKRKKGGK